MYCLRFALSLSQQNNTTMNTTVTMTPTAYKKAVLMAEKQKLSVDEYVSKVFYDDLVIVPMPIEQTQNNKTTHRRALLDGLTGLWAGLGVTAEEMRDEYMKEKYGI